MKLLTTDLPGVVVVEPKVFDDPRGFFMETYHKLRFAEQGIAAEFVQDNHSRSVQNTLRGLHYQIQHPQGKLVRVVSGEIFDVAVDLRRRSPTFGRWTGARLSDQNRRQMYVPPGFAHGFCVISPTAEIVYKCTDFYYPEHDRTLLWNDPAIGINWPLGGPPILSAKDEKGKPLAEADNYDE
jgi:dTDP-4-dehydrorhamnose 3,5-epimerase